MVKKHNSPEKSLPKEKKYSTLKWWVKATTAAAFLTLAWCDNIQNNEIRLNPQKQSVEFGIEHIHSEWSAWYNIINYGITISKQWDTYMWLINEKNWWHSKTTSFESNTLNDVFYKISNSLDNDQITDGTRNKQNKKIEFVKKEFENKILNEENSSQISEIMIKYKPE